MMPFNDIHFVASSVNLALASFWSGLNSMTSKKCSLPAYSVSEQNSGPWTPQNLEAVTGAALLLPLGCKREPDCNKEHRRSQITILC